MKLPVPLEKDVHRADMDFYERIGCVVYSTVQARRSNVALGLPDLIVCWPARGVHWAHEEKRVGMPEAEALLSDDQRHFRDTWIKSGGLYLVGDTKDAVRFIEQIRGVAARRPSPPVAGEPVRAQPGGTPAALSPQAGG